MLILGKIGPDSSRDTSEIAQNQKVKTLRNYFLSFVFNLPLINLKRMPQL